MFEEVKRMMRKTYAWGEQEEEGGIDGPWRPWREEVGEEERSVEVS